MNRAAPPGDGNCGYGAGAPKKRTPAVNRRSNVKTAHTLKIREPHVITVTGKAFYDTGHAPADHSNRRTTPKDYSVLGNSSRDGATG
jgi:hypothetical protein